ncbi:MAG: hypothetical protein PHY16_18980 [Methylobacter sp.]|nr:hypothetical protein [Methylobacter sp.]
MKNACDLCKQPLTDYQVLFDRLIERMEYLPMGDDFQAVAIVLSCDDIACYWQHGLFSGRRSKRLAGTRH